MIDAAFVGMFPRETDDVRENAERVCRILAKARPACFTPALAAAG